MGSFRRLRSQRDEDLCSMTDYELNKSILCKRRLLESGGVKFPNEEQLRATLKRLEDEMERRKLRTVDKDANGCKKPTESVGSNSTCNLDGFTEEITSSLPRAFHVKKRDFSQSMPCMEKEGAKKRALVLDCEKRLQSQDEDQPAALTVDLPTMTGHPLKQSEMGSDQAASDAETPLE